MALSSSSSSAAGTPLAPCAPAGPHRTHYNKALREQYSRREINAQRQKIEEKKLEIKKLREALSDVEDELRHAGGDPGWEPE